MKIFKNEIFLLSSLIIFAQFFFLTCDNNNNEIPESSLTIRDNVIYKNGSDIPFTGREKARVENKIIEYDIVDGLKHGDFRLYYESGNIEIIGQIDKNRNIGNWQYFGKGLVSFRDGSPSGKAGESEQISEEHPLREGTLLPPSFANSKSLDDPSVPHHVFLL